jgi:hypothetical protein
MYANVYIIIGLQEYNIYTIITNRKYNTKVIVWLEAIKIYGGFWIKS